MFLWTVFKVAFKSIWANKMRSFLTLLGVIIGVGAVVAMMGLGTGIRESIIQNVRGMGANLLTVRAGSRGFGGVRTGKRGRHGHLHDRRGSGGEDARAGGLRSEVRGK